MRTSRLATALAAVIVLLSAMSAYTDSLTHEVYGTVTYPDGSPAPGVRLVWQRLNECRENEATTDAKGCYKISFQGQDGGNYVGIQAQQGDYVLRDSVTVPEGSRAPARKDLVLQFACLVLGEVTDESTGQPIGDASVNIYGSYGAETTTGPNGLFRARVPRTGGLQLVVKKDGYVTKRMEFSAQDTDVTGWRVQLKPGGVVRGQVTDQDGKPVVGMRVDILEDSCYARCVKTGEDGRYVMRDVDPDRPAELGLRDPRLSISSSKFAEFAEGSREAVADFVVDLAGRELRTVSGMVTDESGAPVAGAKVHFGQSTCHSNKKIATTDAQGNYTLTGLTPDKDLILAQAEGYAPSFMPVDDTGDQRIDVTLTRAHSAELRVLDCAGKPLGSVSVTVDARTPVLAALRSDYLSERDIYRWLYTTTTDENGKVVLKNLPSDGVLVDLYKKNYIAPNNTVIRTDASDNAIEMQGMPQVAGTVVDAATGAPIRSFTVKWFTPGGYSLGGDDNAAFNKPDGKFVVPVGDSRSVDVRQFAVKVLADGYVGETLTISATDAPRVDYSNVFKLEKSFGVRGIVVDSFGKGVPDAQVTVVESHGYWSFMVPAQISRTAYQQKLTTGPGGCFDINPLRERVGTIIVEKDGYPKLIEQDTDLTKPLKLVLQTPAVLTVKAAGMVGAEVDLAFQKNHCGSVVPRRDIPAGGQLRYDVLEPGHYIVCVRGEQQSEMRAFDLQPGKPFTVDLDSKRLVTVSGVVTKSGKPIAGMSVSIRRGINAYESRSTTDAQGRYTISVESPGPAELTRYRMANGYTIGCDSQPVSLRAGANTLNVSLPSGTVSGRLVDATTGQPLAGELVSAWAKWQPPAVRSYDRPAMQGGYGREISSATTGKDGSFALGDLPDGPVVLVVRNQHQRAKWIGSPLTVSQKEPVAGVEIRMPEPGRLGVSVVDSETGKPVDASFVQLYTPDGAPVRTDNRYRETTDVPAGKYKIWVEPLDGRHLPAYANIEVRSGKTAMVTVKLNAAGQRIVFRAVKGGKLDKLRWPDKDHKPLSGSAKVIANRPDDSENRPWIGLALSDASTGRPVLAGPEGPRWGDHLTGFDSKREAVLPVKPGTYSLDAVLRNTEDYAVASESNLWHERRRVAVVAGKDAVVTVR